MTGLMCLSLQGEVDNIIRAFNDVAVFQPVIVAADVPVFIYQYKLLGMYKVISSSVSRAYSEF